jgi:hypothetical protein
MAKLQAELAECDAVLSQPLRAMWAVQLVHELVGGRKCDWVTGYRSRHNARFVAVLLSDGTVSVWQTDRYQFDRLLGIITPDTTRADVWRMRQQAAWIRAAELGLIV